MSLAGFQIFISNIKLNLYFIIFLQFKVVGGGILVIPDKTPNPDDKLISQIRGMILRMRESYKVDETDGLGWMYQQLVRDGNDPVYN